MMQLIVLMVSINSRTGFLCYWSPWTHLGVLRQQKLLKGLQTKARKAAATTAAEARQQCLGRNSEDECRLDDRQAQVKRLKDPHIAPEKRLPRIMLTVTLTYNQKEKTDTKTVVYPGSVVS
jgi:hypothetical protein